MGAPAGSGSHAILRIEGKQFRGLVDTGADVSVISKEFWPPSWSTTEAMGSVKGVGVPDDTQRSAAVLRWQDEEGQTGWFQPYIISGIAVNLWGRDVLEGLQACIVTGKGKQGYACIFPENFSKPVWIPARNIKLQQGSKRETSQTNEDLAPGVTPCSCRQSTTSATEGSDSKQSTEDEEQEENKPDNKQPRGHLRHGAQCANSCTLKGTVGTGAGLNPSSTPPSSPSCCGPRFSVCQQPCSRHCSSHMLTAWSDWGWYQ
ncbi:hypothetical protein QTO34_014429 [Cnephaeus nilssonii]|uniref:Peptidase A2 domain-containing protein n=1 Tax=Cnephaeus nilssonii TaxID=3371016 RepID=A0AA40LUA5_CNENI|nr:hypothetical protein QTO34_014429 [Eptesicus nilssonii]